MKNTNEAKPKINGLKQKLTLYFEQNSTAYTYLFFVPVVIVVGNYILNKSLKSPSGVLIHLPFELRLYSGIVTFIFLFSFFILAAHMTFKYPPGLKRFDKYSLVGLHIALTGMVIVAASAI